MTTVSQTCREYFVRDEFHKAFPRRAARRNIARFIYRQIRRPGLVNPSEPGEKPVLERSRMAGSIKRPMRHVHKHYDPDCPKRKIIRHMIPRLCRQHRKLA